MSLIGIVGFSGEGKSTSIGENKDIGIIGLNPKETVLINVAGKDLPFKGGLKLYSGELSKGGNYLESSDSNVISKAIAYISDNRKEVKQIVIDDSQYLMSFEFMNRARETGYQKFSDIGVNITRILNAGRNTRKDLKVYMLWHPEKDMMGTLKMKTVGKMVS